MAFLSYAARVIGSAFQQKYQWASPTLGDIMTVHSYVVTWMGRIRVFRTPFPSPERVSARDAALFLSQYLKRASGSGYRSLKRALSTLS